MIGISFKVCWGALHLRHAMWALLSSPKPPSSTLLTEHPSFRPTYGVLDMIGQHASTNRDSGFASTSTGVAQILE